MSQADIFKIQGTILLQDEEFVKGLKSALGEAEKGSSKMANFFSKVGKSAVAVGKTVAKGMAVVGAGVTAMVTKSVQSYADYEQLVGGVDTLFKKSSDKVQEYARNAYKTAGLSANDYMETVTSFSASLLQSLGGDTAKSADKANMAITDMSDNANKMGTSMEMIQNAYQGFAKQNYTMLDNLKLGYGGTKGEMERLLKEAQKISGIKYDIDSYADVVDAIHVIQKEMGITGTTANEASKTISGSINSMKGAWQNLLTAVSADDLPFDEYMDAFINSVSDVSKNVLPRVQIALDGVVKLIEKLAPQIISKIPGLVSTLLPSVIKATMTLIEAITSNFPKLVTVIVKCIPDIVKAFVKLVPMIIEALLQALPTLVTAGIQLILSLLKGLSQMIPRIILAIIEIVPEIVNALVKAIPQLIQGAIQFFMAIIKAFPAIIEAIVTALPQIINAIIGALIGALPQLIDGAIMLFMALIQAIHLIIPPLVSAIPQIVASIVSALLENLPALVDGACTLFLAILEAVPTIIIELAKCAPDIVKGLVDGLIKAITEVDWGGIWKSVITGFKKLFGIESPSKVFKGFGGNIVDGLFNGLKNMASKVGEKFTELKNKAVEKFTDIKNKVTTKATEIKDKAVEKFNDLKDKASNKFSDLKTKASEKFGDIKSAISDKLSEAKNKAVGYFQDINSATGGKLGNLVSTVAGKFGDVYNSIKDKMGNAKAKVGEMMDGIKSSFSKFSGKIKLPHFKISGSLNPAKWFEGQAPKLSVEWYAKAMDKGIIMDKPTAFGINNKGQIMAGGEKGSETIVGTNSLMGMIQGAVTAQNAELNAKMEILISMLSRYLPELTERQLVLDSGEMVGALTYRMDRALGDLSEKRGRGR